MAGFWDFMFGNQGGIEQVNNWNPAQQQMAGQYFNNPIQNNPLYQGGSNYIQQMLQNNPEAFKHFEAPYMQNFEQNIAPGIAERFAGAGTGSGASSSSGLYNSLSQAGRNLQTDLAGLRGQLQMQALQQALGYAQQPYNNMLAGLQLRPFENVNREGTGGLFGTLGQGALAGAGFALGGPMGGALAMGASNMFNRGGGQQGGGGGYMNSRRAAIG